MTVKKIEADMADLRERLDTAMTQLAEQKAEVVRILSFNRNIVTYTHRTESTSVETVVAFKALLIRLSRTAQWHQPHWRHSTTA